MTKEELEKIIEADLFQQRGFLLRYIDYGKALVADEIFAGLDVIDREMAMFQKDVELSKEKQVFEELKAKYAGEVHQELLKEFEALLRNVDAAHTALITDYRKPRIEDLKSKYKKPASE